MKKITFYGKDFSPLTGAKYRLDGSDQAEVEGKYLTLLEDFCTSYEIVTVDKKTANLLFPKNTALFNKYVGVFRKKEFPFYCKINNVTEIYDVTLEISCRFDEGDKAYFLMAMLLCLTGEELHFIKPEVNISFHQAMDVFLLFMFKNQLAVAAKKGIFRRYQRFENNDSRPHGTIDIARHIRENMGLNNGKIAYYYRELSADNPVNRLILAAYKRLREKFPGLCEKHISRDGSVSSTLKMLQTELGWSKTSLRNIIKDNLRPVTHPYFSEYEALRRTCLKILRDEGVSIFDAKSAEETDAIYFNITRLWEKYLESQFNRLGLPEGLECSAQESDTFLRLEQGEGGINKIAKPDFLFKKDGKNIAVLDAKFKPQWMERKNDFLTGDIDECIRNLVVFGTRRTGVIYPADDSEGLHGEFSVAGKKTREQENHTLFFDVVFDVVKVAVPKPGGEEFGAWSKQLDDKVSSILKEYLEHLETPAATQQ